VPGRKHIAAPVAWSYSFPYLSPLGEGRLPEGQARGDWSSLQYTGGRRYLPHRPRGCSRLKSTTTCCHSAAGALPSAPLSPGCNYSHWLAGASRWAISLELLSGKLTGTDCQMPRPAKG